VLNDHDIEIIRQDFWADPALPVADASVDVATCFDVVEHLPGHPLRQLRELHRMLRPGGRCLLSGPNGVSLMKRLRTMAGQYPYAPFEAWVSEPFYEHYREYAPAEYEELLRRSGFRNVASRGSAAVTLCRARKGYHRRRLSRLSPKRAALWGVAAVETAVPGMRHVIYAWGDKDP
jgi:SAM-dependent methyltransferase